MDFKDYLSIAKTIAGKPFTALTTEEVHRIEKHVRLESKFPQDSDNGVLLNFINALLHHKDGLDFLEANPAITYVLFHKPEKLHKHTRIQVYDYDLDRIKHFFTSCLLSELLETIGSELQSKKYVRLFELVKYHRFLPEVVVSEIIKGIHTRLDFIQTKLAARLESASQDVHDVKAMVVYLGNVPLKTRWTQMNVQAIGVVLSDDETGGSTFTWIDNYFDALFDTSPKTAFEQEKRGELLRGCNCAMGFIVLMFVFFGAVIWMITATHESTTIVKKPPSNIFQGTIVDLPKELATFQYNKSTTLYDIERPETNSGKLGVDFLPGTLSPLIGTNFLINETTSDMIVFSTGRNKPISQLKRTSRYVRAGDSIQWSPYLGTRLYIGNNPKYTVQEGSTTMAPRLRFLEMKEAARALVQKEFYFKGKLTVRDSLDYFYLDNTGTLEFSNLNTVE